MIELCSPPLDRDTYQIHMPRPAKGPPFGGRGSGGGEGGGALGAPPEGVVVVSARAGPWSAAATAAETAKRIRKWRSRCCPRTGRPAHPSNSTRATVDDNAAGAYKLRCNSV